MSRANEAVFPFEVVNHYYGGGCDERVVPGLTIREHFAGLAMQGVLSAVLSNPEVACAVRDEADAKDIELERYLAVMVIQHADALIAELAKERP